MRQFNILHCDMNNYFASVELLDFPQYKNKPVAIAGDPSKRHGVILAKNDLAKSKGINTADTVWESVKKCPELILLPPNFKKYKDYSNHIKDIYFEYTDLIEPFSIDEAWLDISPTLASLGDSIQIANKIRTHIKNELGLTLSIGVSDNKIYAKMGSNYKKPDFTTLVTRDNFLNLFGEKPVIDMFFVGKASSKKLYSINCKTIKQLFMLPQNVLIDIFGKYGGMLYDYVHGLSEKTVSNINKNSMPKSVGTSTTFTNNLTEYKDLLKAIEEISQRVSLRLRNNKLKALGIKLEIKDNHFITKSKQVQLKSYISSSSDISKVAQSLLQSLWKNKFPIRLLGITAINLTTEDSAEHQISLFEIDGKNKSHKSELIEQSMDLINKKYGNNVLIYGNKLEESITKSDKEFVINQMLDEI